MTKEEFIIFIESEIEGLRVEQKEAKSNNEIVCLSIEIRKYTELLCELKGFLNRYPQVNVEMPKEGGAKYGDN